MYKTIDCGNCTFMLESIVQVTAIRKSRIVYKYLLSKEFPNIGSEDYSQSIEDFKMGTVELTDLEKALL